MSHSGWGKLPTTVVGNSSGMLVLLTGYQASVVKPIELVKAIRRHTGLGLRAAKDIVDPLMTGERTLLIAPNADVARALIRDAAALGVTAEIRQAGENPAS
jgi:ribosomal protein L7/L12